MENKKFKPNDNFIYYLYWIKERMNIFWKKYNGESSPYTDDEILRDYKFTNVYRVLDRVSQDLIKNVINNDKHSKEDTVYRILIYKHFNLPYTFNEIEKNFGELTIKTDLNELILFLSELKKAGKPLYSNAYMTTASFMRSNVIMGKYGLTPGMPKYESYIKLFNIGLFDCGIMDRICNSKTFYECFSSLKEIVGVSDFMGYQFVQDISYTKFFNFNNNEFCAAGPGTIRGVERTFDIKEKVEHGEIVIWVYNNFDKLVEEYSNKFDVDLIPKFINNYPAQVSDLSNCFCETDKYMRGLNVSNDKNIEGKRIKQLFKENSQKIDYVFPEKWNVNI